MKRPCGGSRTSLHLRLCRTCPTGLPARTARPTCGTIDDIADEHQVAVGIVRKWVSQSLAQIGAALEHAEPTD